LLPDAGTAWRANDSRHATQPREQLPSYSRPLWGGAEQAWIGPAAARQHGKRNRTC
jgi:hypothetical protein